MTAHSPTKTIKTFVNQEGKTTIVCPGCSRTKVLDVASFQREQHRIRINCPCSHVFIVNLDFRQNFRRKTTLTGRFQFYAPASGSGIVDIQNISLSGIAFRVQGVHQIETGNRGQIEFILDNKKKTVITKEFTVRSVRGYSIGCEFSKVQAFEKDLGFYLRFGA